MKKIIINLLFLFLSFYLILAFDYKHNYKYVLISAVSGHFTQNQIDNTVLRDWMMNNQVVPKEKVFSKLDFSLFF